MKRNNILLTIIGASLIAMAPAIAFADHPAPTETEELRGVVQIGGLFPITGSLSSFGETMETASRTAVADFNMYLKSMDAGWSIQWVMEDTGTNPNTALDKIQALHSRGVTAVVGPATSGSLSHIKGYADSNGIVLVSPSSTAPSLAIPDDNVFRLVPSDFKQGAALAELLSHNGIEYVVPIWRGDTYGDGLKNAAVDEFEKRGGQAHEGIRYSPDTSEFSVSVNQLNSIVHQALDEYDADKVAVLIIAFAEGQHIMQSSYRYTTLRNVEWFGSEALTQSKELVDDRITKRFLQDVNFTTVQFLVSPGEKADKLEKTIRDALGRNQSSFDYPSYDAVWVLGKAIMAAGSTDADAIIDEIPHVTEDYTGAMSSTKLNAAGDLDLANYQVWTTDDGKWVKTSKYIADENMITAADQPEGLVEIGSLYPLTGRLSSKGSENLAGTQLGVSDFNAFLKSINEDWRLRLSIEDSETNPNAALRKAQILFSKGIDIVIGPETSGNTRQVKPYADTNDMILISCCSTAPNLAIAGDSVFRLVPDDSKQGVAVGKLLREDGIEAVVAIWRNDAYGEGLFMSSQANFQSRGGMMDNSISYSPDAVDFSGEVSSLASQVQELVNRYGKDKVAVFMISFDESVQIVQSAANYGILKDVRWYGSESLTKGTPIISDRIGNAFVNEVGFKSLQIKENRGDLYERIQMHIMNNYGRDPTTFVYQAYDASWLVGLSILKTGMTDAASVKDVIHEIAADYDGALGGTNLNEAGDLAAADYAVWTIEGDKWVELAVYSLLRDTIEPIAGMN